MPALKVKVYNHQGQPTGEESLPEKVFGVALKEAVVHQAVVAQQASGRQVLAHTKGRGDVRGGGRKPWRQKHTGRARHGSTRSPIWVGGGITFGPTKERNFALKINKKMRQQALRMVLSDKLKHERIVIVEDLPLDEPKTKQLKKWLDVLPSKGRTSVLVTSTTDRNLILSSRNLPKTNSLGVKSLNVVDILRPEYVIIPKKTLSDLLKIYGK